MASQPLTLVSPTVQAGRALIALAGGALTLRVEAAGGRPVILEGIDADGLEQLGHAALSMVEALRQATANPALLAGRAIPLLSRTDLICRAAGAAR